MLEIAAPAAVLVALYAVVGGGLAWLLRLRGLWLVAAAPVFATTVIAGTSVITGWLGLGWSVLPVLAVAAVIAVLILLVRRFTPRFAPAPSGLPWRWTIVPLVIAGAVMTVFLCIVFGTSGAISQTFDNVFHLNAIRWILDTGDASPLLLGTMTSGDAAPAFYPSAWHATAAIVTQLSGASIPVVVNAQSIVISAIVWPTGAVLLARVLVGASRTASVVASVVAVSVPAFPLLPMDYGVLYPYQLSLALVPFALAATVTLFGIGARVRTPGWWMLIIVAALPGIVLAHPGGFLTWLALSVPIVAMFAWRLWRGARTGGRVLVVVGVLGYGAAGLVLLKLLRPPLYARQWPTVRSEAGAVVSALGVQLYYPVYAVVIALLALAGLGWALRRERTAAAAVAIGMWAVGAVLFVVVISSTWGNLRDALTGGWYNNWQRLAAVFGVALVPLAVLGGTRVVQTLGERVPALTRRPRLWVIVSVALAFLLIPVSAYGVAIDRAHQRYAMTDSAKLLSPDEYALLQRLDEHVPDTSVIVGNPYTGTSLAYALADRDVVMRHILAGPDADGQIVLDRLDEAATDPSVCQAVRDGSIDFVLDFGSREVHGEKHVYSGLDDLVASGVVTLVDSEGDAKLYAVTVCGDE